MTKLYMLVSFLLVIMSSGIIKLFQAASIHSFDLTPTCFCTKELAPVCDIFGVQYSNICTFECINEQNSSIVLGCSHSCPCETISSCETTEPETTTSITNFTSDVTKDDRQFDCLCTKELAPVCDNNGQQYSNSCTFSCLTGQNSSITLACNHQCPCEGTTIEKDNETTITPWETSYHSNSASSEQDNLTTNL